MTATTAPDLGQLQLLDLSKVEVSKLNPRQDVGDLTELAQSIGEIGVLEPIVVVQRNGHYEAIAGSRRLAASRQAGKRQIPARVMSLDEAQQAAAALIENLQRKDLTPLEEAHAYRKYLDLTGVTQKELGQKIGRAPSTVANALRLLEAPKLVKDALERGDITAAHARIALTVPAEYASSLPLKKGVTVQDFEDEARDVKAYADFAESVKEKAAKARERLGEGETLTWSTEEVWAAHTQTSLAKILGKPAVAIAGVLEGEFVTKSYRRIHHRPELHDSLCTCRAYALVVDRYSGDKVKVERACIVPAGYRKYAAGLEDKKTRDAAKDKVTPAQRAKAEREREAARKQKEKRAAEAAVSALEVKVDVPYSANDRSSRSAQKLDPKLLKGGPAGENARLALWALTAREIWNADGGRVSLWQQIARMPIAKVRDLLAQHAAATALEIALSRRDERKPLIEAIYSYYGIAVPEEPKKTKKAKR